MLNLIKYAIHNLKNNKKGSAAGIIMALIIGAAIVIAVYIYTSNQTHPFWEID